MARRNERNHSRKQQKKVSVVVPCCNVEKYVAQCLKSITNQTLKEIEIICINDGSKDNTLSILKSFAEKDERIILIDKPNSGYGDSMNQGFAKAHGEYIGIVESDDFIEPKMFETLYNTAKKQDADVVKSNFWFYWTDSDRNEMHEYFKKEECDKIITPSTYDNGSLFGRKPSIWSAIYKADFIRKNNIDFLPTPGASFQDTSFTFKVYSCAKRMICLYQPFLHYRQDNANSSINNSDKKAYCVCDEYEEIENYIKRCPKERKELLYPIYVTSFYDTCIWMYERLSALKRFEFLNVVSPWLKRLIDEIGIEKIDFRECWWKKRDIVRIANDPYEYHMWRHVERYEQLGSTFTYEVSQTPVNNFSHIKEIQQHKQKTPFFSVIVPVYNSEKYLRPCLESLIFQDYDDIEIICINDGSTDHSLSIIEEYAKCDKRFVIINKKNSGPSDSRNAGLDVALGKYILFLDSDDYYAQNSCKIVKETIKKNNNPDGVIFGTEPFPSEPRASEWHFRVLTTPNRYFNKVDSQTMLTTPYLKIYSWRCSFKNEFLKKNHLHFNSKFTYGEDCLFMFEAVLKMDCIAVISDKLYNYRHYRADSLMDQSSKNHLKYAYDQLDILKQIIATGSSCNVESSKEYLEFICDFMFMAIDQCPLPQKEHIISTFVDIIHKNKLEIFLDEASDNCRGFYNYCKNVSDRYKRNKRYKYWYAFRRRFAKYTVKFRHFVAYFIPPSRRIFYEHSARLMDAMKIQQQQIDMLRQQIEQMQGMGNIHYNTNWAVNELIKKYNDDLLYKFPEILTLLEDWRKKDETFIIDENELTKSRETEK